MSLTNTDPDKTARFPVFDWPCVEVPAVRFPLEPHRAEVEAAEQRAREQAEAAFAAHPHDIACSIAEPVRGEGGDNHTRPEFLRAMQVLCHRHEALFVLDEVADRSRRDLVRSRRLLEIVEHDHPMARAGPSGQRIPGLPDPSPGEVPAAGDNARGLCIVRAFDAPDPHSRDTVVTRVREEHKVLLLPSGERSVRVRPALTVTEEELGLTPRAAEFVLSTVPSAVS